MAFMNYVFHTDSLKTISRGDKLMTTVAILSPRRLVGGLEPLNLYLSF